MNAPPLTAVDLASRCDVCLRRHGRIILGDGIGRRRCGVDCMDDDERDRLESVNTRCTRLGFDVTDDCGGRGRRPCLPYTSAVYIDSREQMAEWAERNNLRPAGRHRRWFGPRAGIELGWFDHVSHWRSRDGRYDVLLAQPYGTVGEHRAAVLRDVADLGGVVEVVIDDDWYADVKIEIWRERR